MRSALLACLASLLLGACADQTGILVQISSSDIAVPADVDGLHIRAHTPDALMVDQSFPIRSSWPHSLLIRPARGEALGEVLVEVTGTLGGAYTVRRVVMTAFIPGQVRRVDVELTRDCLHVACADDVSCVAGACQGMALDSGVTPDAGVVDGGVHDAGMDAFVAVDGGTDGGSDGGSDAGRDAAAPCAGASCVGHVVISEMSTTMSNEFIELYNRTGTNADLGGCSIEYFGAGTWQPRGMLPTTAVLPAHTFYLVANAGYAGTPAPDVPMLWTMGFLDTDAAVRLSCGTTVVDELGYGTTAQREGTPAMAIPTGMLATASYERKALADSSPATMAAGGRDAVAGNGYDTDDNNADFVIRAMRDPQSSASGHEP